MQAQQYWLSVSGEKAAEERARQRGGTDSRYMAANEGRSEKDEADSRNEKNRVDHVEQTRKTERKRRRASV